MRSMFNFVEEITTQFGGRAPGSKAERLAQHWIRDRFSEFSNRVVIEPFHAAVTAKFSSLKIFCGLWYVSLVLMWFSPVAAAAISFFSAFVFMGHMVMYKDWLDVFYPKIESCNVTATLEPSAEVKSTILIAGHADSATEFHWWYRLGAPGAPVTVLGGVVLVFGAIFLLIAAASGAVMHFPFNSWTVGWLICVFFTPLTLTLFSIHGPYGPVDGAIDNLSGVAVAWGIGKHFAAPGNPGKSTLKHTRLKLISFGSEECGLKGSRAYVKAHKETLKAEKAVLLNMESFKDDQHLTILSGELFTGARYPKPLLDRLQQAFHRNKTANTLSMLPFGATDSSSFAAEGIPTTCVIGLDSEKLDPTYHTRLDNTDHLHPFWNGGDGTCIGPIYF